MEKTIYKFYDFFAQVNAEYKSFVTNVHSLLSEEGYRVSTKRTLQGFVVSYSQPKTRRNIVRFSLKEQHLSIRLYADHFHQYMDFMNRLPEEMEREIAKAKDCKKRTESANHTSKCIGYDVRIQGNRYQKCRYQCFQFEVRIETIPVLSEFIENELREINKNR